MSSLRDDLARFVELETEILAINPDTLSSHEKYSKNLGLNLPLLSDPARTAVKEYRVLKENEKSIQRTVYIIDKAGIIRYAKQGMPNDEELLQAIKEFQSQIMQSSIASVFPGDVARILSLFRFLVTEYNFLNFR